MAQVRPFRGIRYNSTLVGDFSRVVCPPYDVISTEEAAVLRSRSLHNAVNLELPEVTPGDTPGNDRYTRAGDLFRNWLEEGALLRERSPAMYLLDEEFIHEGNVIHRQGLTVAARLEEFDKGAVLPHEYTTPGPKADRLALMRAARANFSPLLALYRDPGRSIGALLDKVRQEDPILRARPEGLPRYALWTVTDPPLLSKITQGLAPLPLFLADGHHRYETALRYRDDLEASGNPLPPDAAARYVMMTLVPMEDPGLLVLPYHRLFGGLRPDELASLKRGLEQPFHLEAIGLPAGSPADVARAMEGRLAGYPAGDFAVAALGLQAGKYHMLTLRQSAGREAECPALERCDMWSLHQRAITPALGAELERRSVSFVHGVIEAVERVLSGDQQAAFLLRSMPMDLFEDVVGKGQRLPPKSTYFHPKLPTGLVFNSLEGIL